jgi:cbb3-type cytochrome oxidase maturation protein
VPVEFMSCPENNCGNTFVHVKSIFMSVLIILLIASLSVSLIFLGAFIWSARNRQFDDEFSSSMRILFDDQPVRKEDKNVSLNRPAEKKFSHSDNTSHSLN